jgi:TetR/AcrR family transcriptional regulator, copper-responsive repressor
MKKASLAERQIAAAGGVARGRPRAFDRKKALERAMRLFWSNGYSATSVADLGQAMGVNPPSLYAAFGDKKQLFLEAVDRYREGPGNVVGTAFAGAATARDAVSSLMMHAAKTYVDPALPRGCMVIHAAQNCTQDDRDVAQALAKIRKDTEQAIHDRIRAAKTREFSTPVDTRALARFYAAVMQGMSVMARDGATETELRAIASRAMDAWPTA